MKLIHLALLLTITIIGTNLQAEERSPKAPTQADLRAQAKITEPQAREIARAQVPRGKVGAIELEVEKQLLIWSVDLTTPGTRNITEVQVDAKTGAVVGVQTEAPEEKSAADQNADAKS